MKFKGMFLIIVTLLPLKLLYAVSPENLEKIIQQNEKESTIKDDSEKEWVKKFNWENRKFSIGLYPATILILKFLKCHVFCR